MNTSRRIADCVLLIDEVRPNLSEIHCKKGQSPILIDRSWNSNKRFRLYVATHKTNNFSLFCPPQHIGAEIYLVRRIKGESKQAQGTLCLLQAKLQRTTKTMANGMPVPRQPDLYARRPTPAFTGSD